MDYMGDMDAQDLRRAQLEGAQRQNALQALVAQQQQQEMAYTQQGRNLIRDVYARNPGASLEERAAALEATGHQSGISQADALRKSALDRQKELSGIGKTDAETAEHKRSTAEKKRKEAIQWVMSHGDPAVASEAITQGMRDGSIGEAAGSLMLRTLPKDPAALRSWQVRMAAGLAEPGKMAELLMPLIQTNNTGGFTTTQSVDKITGQPTVTGQIRNTQDPNSVASVAATIRGQNLTDQRARESIAAQRDAAGGVDWKQDTDGNWVGLPKKAVPGGQVVPATASVPGKREAQSGNALGIITEAKRLIGQGTNSYLGAGVDQALRLFGVSTAGADAGAKLKALEGALMMAQPRMEGPQSNMDVLLYRQMAGQIGDPTVPADMKAAALTQIETLHKRYAKGGATAAPSAPKPSVSNW
jgi:hypothetical protein